MPDSSFTPDPIIQTAIERFNLAVEADTQWRTDCLEDLEFSTGQQWPISLLTQRQDRPSLTMDQIQQSVRLVCNQFRQQPPAITVDPIGEGADKKTAEIEQGIIRHIEVNCDAQTTYEQVHEGIVRNGFDSLRLLSAYQDDSSEEQEVLIEKIRNPFSVYWQPGVSQEKAKWCFIIVDLPIAEYKAQYPESKLAGADNFTGVGNAAPEWVNKETIRVAEYFTVDEEKADGSKRGKRKVTWRKINAFEELDKEALPGTTIPVFTAYGDDLDVNGKRHVAGLVRNAKEPQRFYNYLSSGAVEAIALAPKAPWLAVEGSISGYEKLYEKSNVSNVAVLPYKQVDVAGKPAPPPARQIVEPPIQALTVMINQCRGDIKAAMGIYDPSNGKNRADESGVAIKRLQQQGDIATMNYADNMTRMMKRLGRCLLDWIRDKYDEAKVQRIINPDGTNQQVIIHNGPDQAADAQKLSESQGISKIFDIGVGKYDVVITVGPTYQSKRQEAVETQLQLLQHIPPQMVPMYLDLIIRNMDIPQAEEFADRAKKLLPPQLQEDDGTPEAKLAQAQAQLQQLTQQHQQLTQALTHSNQIIQTKQVEQQGKVQIEQSKGQNDIQIEKMKIDAEIAIAEINTKAQNARERAQMYNEIWLELHGSAHEIGMQKDQQAHDAGMAAAGQNADQQSQQADQAHEAGMQQQGQQADAESQAADQAHQQQMATVAQGNE